MCSHHEPLTGRPYKYTAEMGAPCETRHEAVGQAAIAGRKAPDLRMSVMDATSHVYAYEPHICDFCSETFLYEEEFEEHTPCPHYEPTEGRRGSNPIEAARMTRNGL